MVIWDQLNLCKMHLRREKSAIQRKFFFKKSDYFITWEDTALYPSDEKKTKIHFQNFNTKQNT